MGTRRRTLLATMALALSVAPSAALAQGTAVGSGPALALRQQPHPMALAAKTAESTANTMEQPTQILRTGIDLTSVQLSPNSMQLADMLKLTPILERIAALRTRVSLDETPTPANMVDYVALLGAQERARQILMNANLAVDFVTAEITAEQQVYQEILSTLQARAAKRVQWANWGAYYSNGALWAVAEALDIPTWKRPKYSISSGINGIIAGVIPSMASLYAMHAANGSKLKGEADPNMLAKIMNVPTSTETEYPAPVWSFLTAVPPNDRSGRTRRDQLVDRWVADSNLPAFTDRGAKEQIQALAAVTDKKKTVSISLLQTRVTMLSELSAEIDKMKRLLYELSLATSGQKELAPRQATLQHPL